MALLEVSHLGVGFRGADGEKDNTAVDDVSFALEAGEVLGVVGESGSGKSVTALSILGLLPYPKAYHMPGSSVRFAGRELIGAPEEELRRVRGNEIAFVFQEPMSSLNPLHTIEKQIGETLRLHRQLSEKEAKKEVLRLLKMTGIKNARARMKAYPFELSGGQRQRVMIAMAIANHPKILIADEPTTALDVTIQAQIIDLLMDLRKKMDMAIIFISHDLRIVRKIADRIAVMKEGFIQQAGAPEELYASPANQFVAGFLGNPPMNFLNVKVGADGSDYTFTFGKSAVRMPQGWDETGVLKSYVGKNVVLGVRPKDVHDDPAFVEKMEKGVVNAEVEVMESVGGESYLYLTCSGHSITAGVDADAMRQSGEQIQIAFDMEKIKLFDSDTEHTIWR